MIIKFKDSKVNKIKEHKNEIIVLHDFDGRPYFQALEEISADNQYCYKVEYRELTIVWRLLSAFKHKKLSFNLIKQSYKNTILRIQVPFISNKIFIVGMAPCNIRLLWYVLLSSKNRFIYHTSWHKWQLTELPWRYNLFTPIIANLWKYLLLNNKIEIVCVTETAKVSLNKFLCSADDNKSLSNIHVIPHAVSMYEFCPAENKTNNEKLGFLFVGRLVEEKGGDIFFQIAQKINNKQAYFTMIGDGPKFQQYKIRADRLSNFQMLGHINDRHKLAQIYQEHDFLIVPSIRSIKTKWEELFGVVIIEAMASGLVVIASDHVGPKEIIKNGFNGFLVPENNSSTVLNIINLIIENPILMNNIRRNAVETAAKYSMYNIKSLWLKLLQN